MRPEFGFKHHAQGNNDDSNNDNDNSYNRRLTDWLELGSIDLSFSQKSPFNFILDIQRDNHV